MDSAIEESGSLPMSSAEIDSTIEVLVCLVSIAFSMPRRIPTTCTVCEFRGSLGGIRFRLGGIGFGLRGSGRGGSVLGVAGIGRQHEGGGAGHGQRMATEH